MQGEIVFDLSCTFLIASGYVKQATVQLVEADAGEEAVINFRADNSRHAGLYRQVLDFGELHFCCQDSRLLAV